MPDDFDRQIADQHESVESTPTRDDMRALAFQPRPPILAKSAALGELAFKFVSLNSVNFLADLERKT